MEIDFTVRGNPNLLRQSFPSFEQACAAWYRDGRFGAVLRADLGGRVIESFTREECDAAAKRFLNPKIANRDYSNWWRQRILAEESLGLDRPALGFSYDCPVVFSMCLSCSL